MTGVVLRRLLSDPTLEGITHVVVDEVHERSADSDLLLLLLRDLLSTGSNPSLRVVLMSATAEAGAFVQYFDATPGKVGRSSSHNWFKMYAQGCPSGLLESMTFCELRVQGQQTSSCSIVNIPGFTHPVEDFYLEDVLEQTGFQIGRGSK